MQVTDTDAVNIAVKVRNFMSFRSLRGLYVLFIYIFKMVLLWIYT